MSQATANVATAAQLQEELIAAQGRRAALKIEVDAAQQSLADARKAVIDGTGTTADVITAQNNFNAIAGTLDEEMDTKIAELKQQLKDAQAREQKQALQSRRAMLEAQIKQQQVQMNVLMQAASDAVAPIVQELLDVMEQQENARNEYGRVQSEIGVSQNLAVYPFQAPEQRGDHGAGIWFIVETVGNKRKREQYREVQRAAAARQAEREANPKRTPTPAGFAVRGR